MAQRNSNEDIDKLLEIASAPKVRKVKPIKTNPEIDKFIADSVILPGKTRVPTYMVYYRYYLWKKIKLVPRLKFINYLKTKFEKTRTDDGVGFLLNPKGFDLTPQGFFRARAHLRRERDEKQKKE